VFHILHIRVHFVCKVSVIGASICDNNDDCYLYMLITSVLVMKGHQNLCIFIVYLG